MCKPIPPGGWKTGWKILDYKKNRRYAIISKSVIEGELPMPRTKIKQPEETKPEPQTVQEDETEALGTIIAVVLGIIFLAWIIFITPAILNSIFWKP